MEKRSDGERVMEWLGLVLAVLTFSLTITLLAAGDTKTGPLWVLLLISAGALVFLGWRISRRAGDAQT